MARPILLHNHAGNDFASLKFIAADTKGGKWLHTKRRRTLCVLLSINMVNRKRVARFFTVFLCSPFFLIDKLISSFDSIMTEQDDHKVAMGSQKTIPAKSKMKSKINLSHI